MRHTILFLSQCLPYPPTSGVTQRTFNILRQLSRAFDIRLVAFSRRNHQSNSGARAAAERELSKYAEVLPSSVIPSEWSRARRLWNHLRSTARRRPYTFYEYDHRDFRRSLSSALKRSDVELVHMDSLDLYRWSGLISNIPLCCTHHNIESQLLRRRARHIGSPVLERYLQMQARLVENTERTLCPEFAANIMVSDVDADGLQAIAPGSRNVVVPNGVDTDFFAPRNTEEQVPGRVMFLGPLYMLPNSDAVDFFLSDIWSAILGKDAGATFEIIGKTAEEAKKRHEAVARVSCAGFVDDIRDYVAQAQCFVVPLRIGGGTRLKILDAWAMKKAVVSTSIGCEGLHAVDGENILIRDDPGDFAAAVVEVLRDDRLRRRLEINARETACDRYSWDIIGAELVREYSRLLGSDRGR